MSHESSESGGSTANSSESSGNNPRHAPAEPAGENRRVRRAPAEPVGENRRVRRAHAEPAGENRRVQELEQLVAEMRREIVELRGNQAQRVQVPEPPPPPPRGRDDNVRDYLKILEHMRGIGTTRFRGTTNPIEADDWLEGLKRNMSVSRCPDDFKKDVAVFFLEKDAVHWWKRVEKRYRNADIRWEDFQQEFESKYFPPEARERLETQFTQLHQGNLSVRDYEAEFTRLSHYAPSGTQEEDMLIRKFIRGLDPCLRSRIQATDFRSLYELVERAVRIEEDLVEERAMMRTQMASSITAPGINRREGNRPNMTQGNRQNRGNRQGRTPFCRQCRTRHSGQCRRDQGKGLCYICRGVGHLARNCPNGANPSATSSATDVTCFGCGEVGHYATSCPNKKIMARTDRPTLPAPPAKRPAITARAYALEAGPSMGNKDKAKEEMKDPIAG